jgi:uncharacterized protein (DUF2141 family)
MKYLLLIASVFASQYLQAQETYTLTVEVANIEQPTGSIRACLISEEANFLGACKRGEVKSVRQKNCELQFKNIPLGSYAIMLYHDENNNDELDKKGLFGLPGEPYGFSNNPLIFFGPPSFEDCLVHVKSDQRIQVKLK